MTWCKTWDIIETVIGRGDNTYILEREEGEDGGDKMNAAILVKGERERKPHAHTESVCVVCMREKTKNILIILTHVAVSVDRCICMKVCSCIKICRH